MSFVFLSSIFVNLAIVNLMRKLFLRNKSPIFYGFRKIIWPYIVGLFYPFHIFILFFLYDIFF